MLTRPEAADPAVEELKRRARRRLVGAVVLALAAAVLLPLLLESDPKPLGDDVSIQIPPIDSGKFITPLSPAKGSDGKADRSAPLPPSPPPAQAGATSDAAGDAKPSGADAASNAAEPAPRSPNDVAPSPAPKATSLITATPDVQKPAADAPKGASADPRPTEAHATATGFVVQLAAFADAKSAASLASKLKSAGFPAYIETSKTPQGTMRRVRVGPYPARDAADAQLVKLSAAGYRGVVTTK